MSCDAGGLTEEEIAAFHANKAKKAFTTPLSVPAKGAAAQTEKAINVDCHQRNDKEMFARSFHSELEFSDSETE